MVRPTDKALIAKYIPVVESLADAITLSGATQTSVAKLLNIPTPTLQSYINKRRNLSNTTLADRMVVLANALNELVITGELPAPPEVTFRKKTKFIVDVVSKRIC